MSVVYGGGATYGPSVYGGAAYPANLVLLAQNILEGAGLVASPAGTNIDRLCDRDRGPQWIGSGNGQHDITISAPYGVAVSAIALVNHTIVTTIEIAGSDTLTFGAPFQTATLVAADPFFLLFPTQTFHYYNVRINTGGPTVPKIGELMLGLARVISLSPALASSGVAEVSNVQRDRAPGGAPWSVRKGPERDRLPYSWAGLGGDDLVQLATARDECDDGAKNLIVRDPLGVPRWVSWTSETFAPVPVSGPAAGNLWQVPDATFEVAP